MVPPRFLFIERSSRNPAWVPGWPGAWAQGEDGQPAPSTWSAWRLIGSNNRELGRSFSVFANLPACHRSLGRMRAGAARLEPSVAIDPETSTWGWRLALDDHAVAASGRSYRRHRECLYNLDKFLAALPVAVLAMPGHVVDLASREQSPSLNEGELTPG